MTLEAVGPVLLVGAGKMGGAMLQGWLDRGLPGDRIIIRDPSPGREVAALIVAHGLRTAIDVPPAIVVLAVKPQVMDEVLAGIASDIPADALVVSVAAGKTIAGMAGHLRPGTPIVRTIPNTPAAIGRGITVCVPGPGVSERQRADATALLEAGGEVAWIDDEGLMDAVTAVSGSGPAYVFLLAECLAAAGIAQGIPPDLAARLARVTVSGAGELMRRSDLDPATLRQNVTSPGGTTAAALSVLMGEGGVEPLMREAVAAATRRGRELAG